MKLRYFLYGAVTAVVISSCTDLDVDVKSVYTEYPTSPIALEAQTSEAYYNLRGALGRRLDEGVSMNSDEYIGVSFDGDYLGGRDLSSFVFRCINPSTCHQLEWFQDMTGAVTKCNSIIVNLGGDDAVAAAPVRAARAFYTFMLMEMWGDVPVLDHVLDEDEIVERSPRADVARWIESELLAVRENCPSELTVANYGKPTRWMVDALLAKLYINWNVYTQDVTSASWSASAANEKINDCVVVCDDIIESGLFNLDYDYKKKFMSANGFDVKDFIYAMPYDAVTQQGMVYARWRTWRRGQKENGLYTMEMSKSVGGNFTLNPTISSLFCLDGDRRNDVVIGNGNEDYTPVYQYDAVTGEKTDVRNNYKGEDVTFSKYIHLKQLDQDINTGADLAGWTQGYRSIKFFPNVEEYNVYDRNQSNDVPIFRYADVLLMKAEAILRGASATNGESAMSLFNQIRSAVNAPVLASEPTLKDILDERGREFLDEHWRRNDLIRFGEFESCLSNPIFIFTNPATGEEKSYSILDLNPNAANPQNRLWPIYQGVLDVNTNWKQNPGY